MFKKFLDALTGAEPAPAQKADRVDLATAALLVHVARRDHDYADDEREMIVHVLADAFGMPAEKAQALRAEAETAEEEANGVFRFTKILKDNLDEAGREEFLERIWKVVLADGARDAEENAFMRKLSALIYVEDKASNRARMRAQTALSAEAGKGHGGEADGGDGGGE